MNRENWWKKDRRGIGSLGSLVVGVIEEGVARGREGEKEREKGSYFPGSYA